MKKGLLGGSLRVVHQEQPRGGPFQCCTLVWISVASVSTSTCSTRQARRSSHGQAPTATVCAASPPAFRAIGSRCGRRSSRMTGARFVHDQLELAGWEVEIADAQKVKGLAPLACKTDRIDAWVLAELPGASWPAIWLPDPTVRAERERARFRLHLVRHRSSLKQRVHATLLTHGKPCPVSDLFGTRGRELLARLRREPWAGDVEACLRLIDELNRELDACERELCRLGAEHQYVPLLTTIPGIAWVIAYTIAAEIGDIARFPSPPSWPATPASVSARLPIGRERPARPAQQERPPLPALGADRGDHPRQQTPRLPRPLRKNETPARQTARPQGRPGRPRPQARRGHLAHAHP